MRTTSNASNQAATLRVTATADMSISVIPVRVQPTDTPTAQSRSEESSFVPLSSMVSLRGPQARSNRATMLTGINCAPSVNVPTGIRFPHNSKKWQLGVGKCLGEATLEGVFAMGKKEAEIVFQPRQLICPFRGTLRALNPLSTARHGHTTAFRMAHQAASTSTPTIVLKVPPDGYGWRLTKN